MSVLAQPSCSLHRGKKAEFVNALIDKGWINTSIVSAAKRAGYEIKAETIAAHRTVCRNPRRRTPGDKVELAQKDLAILVRDRVAKELDELEITVKDGLMAQQLLDRREETRRDREFMINLARLLTGGGASAPAGLVEEGVVIDVTPSDNRLLAPAALRDPG